MFAIETYNNSTLQIVKQSKFNEQPAENDKYDLTNNNAKSIEPNNRTDEITIAGKIQNNNRNKTSVSLVKYKRKKKLNLIYNFLLHCGAILFIGLFSKYALSEEIVEYNID